MSTDPWPGQTLGRWRLIRLLGSGAVGRVYLAEPIDGEGEDVAIKILHAHLASDPQVVARFAREARIAASFRDPRIVALHASGEVDVEGLATPYLVMERVEGIDLDVLRQRLGVVPEALCRHIAREVAAALVIMHAQGVVHRDLKPANILVCRDHHIKLLDLGIARGTTETAMVTTIGDFIGSVAYAAPEQIEATHELTGRFDLYSLGVILYELATGGNPFVGTTLHATIERHAHHVPPPPSARIPALTPFFDRLVMALLEKDPETRLDSATYVLGIVAQGLASQWATDHGWPAPVRRLGLVSSVRLAGRDAVLAAAVATCEASGPGQPAWIRVLGEAGSGVTRMLDTLSEGLTAKGMHLFLTGARIGDDAERLWARILDRGARIDPLGALESVAQGGPVVIVVDDIDRLGAGVLDELLAVLHRLRAHHWILLTGRERPGVGEAVAEAPEGVTAHACVLEPLDVPATRAILHDATRHGRTAKALAEPVNARCGGNPAHMLALVRHMQATGMLVRGRGGRLELPTPVGPQTFEGVPGDLPGLLTARVETLTGPARRLLGRLSLLGERFDVDAYAFERGIPPLSLLLPLASIERNHGFIHAHGSQHRFTSGRVYRLFRAIATREGLSQP